MDEYLFDKAIELAKIQSHVNALSSIGKDNVLPQFGNTDETLGLVLAFYKKLRNADLENL